MSTRPGLFYAYRLGKHIHIYIFVGDCFFVCFLFCFVLLCWVFFLGGGQSYRIQIIFKQIYLTHKWDPNRNHRSGSEGTGQWTGILQSPKVEPHHQMQLSVISRTFLLESLTSQQGRISQHILNLTDIAIDDNLSKKKILCIL